MFYVNSIHIYAYRVDHMPSPNAYNSLCHLAGLLHMHIIILLTVCEFASTEYSFYGHLLNGFALSWPLHEWLGVIDHFASDWFGVIDHFARHIAFGAPGLFSQAFKTHLIRHIHNILFEDPCLLY